MQNKFSKFDTKMEIWDILEDLNSLVDVSDPDDGQLVLDTETLLKSV